MNYLEWNDEIAKQFFTPEMADKRIYLFVTTDLIEKIGERSGVHFEDFIHAVKEGPPWVTRSGLCQKAHQACEGWRNRHHQFPPYIAYLALFVLAAGVEGDFATHSYYPRLRTLLGEEPRTGQYPSYDRMIELWDDLEKWSNEDQAGHLGIFRAYIAGAWIHVGRPTAQTLFTEHERAALPVIFAEVGFDPNSPPSEHELLTQTAFQAANKLRPKTIKYLSKPDELDADLFNLYVETLQEELEAWDGIAAATVASDSQGSQRHGSLSLGLKLDTVAGRVKQVFLRCRTKAELPDEGLFLCSLDNTVQLTADASGLGWSSPLKIEKGATFDASTINWLQGVRLREATLGWGFSLRGSNIRLFIDGAPQGISGLTEIHYLPASMPFYLAAHESVVSDIAAWGENECTGFNAVQIQSGLPAKWLLFHVNEALGDKTVRTKYPMLCLPRNVHLTLEGGVRASRGKQYFNFAPPRLSLRGPVNGVTVTCDGVALNRLDDQNIYLLPDDAPVGRLLAVKVINSSGDTVQRCNLELVNEFAWPRIEALHWFDSYGKNLPASIEQESALSGCQVRNLSVPFTAFNMLIEVSESRRVLFIGRSPGEVVDWPREPLPENWTAIWAVPMRRKGKAVFCGNDLKSSGLLVTTNIDQKKLKLWKEVLWHWRKKISPPVSPLLRNLWQEYMDAAHRI